MPNNSSDRLDSFLTHYASGAVFLLGAVALVLPSGYSIGSALLLLGSFSLLWQRPVIGLTRRDWLLIGVLAIYGTLGILDGGLRGEGLADMDRPLRFLLAVPVLLFLLAYPPRLAALWSGLALGAIAAGSWAGWQRFVQGIERAHGYTHLIQYGNFSLMLGMFCLAGLGWSLTRNRATAWSLLLIAGAIGGLLGSVLARAGGWIAIPALLLICYLGYRRYLSCRIRCVLVIVAVSAMGLIYIIPQTGVQARIDEAIVQIDAYQDGSDRTSSIGYRLEMWRGAWRLFLEKPLWGWNELGYVDRMQTLAQTGVIERGAGQFNQAHNEFFDTAAKKGLVGLFAMLTLYLIPLLLFARAAPVPNMAMRAVALSGLMLPVSYLIFGLTQTPMRHNSGVMMYAFWLVVLWATLRSMERRSIAE